VHKRSKGLSGLLVVPLLVIPLLFVPLHGRLIALCGVVFLLAFASLKGMGGGG
jgi:hypothetical protein